MLLLTSGTAILTVIVVAPTVALLVLALGALFGQGPSERTLQRLFAALSALVVGATAAAAGIVWWSDGSIAIPGTSHPYFRLDQGGSLLLLAVTTILGIAGNVSSIYVHKDGGFRRYFLAYAMLFAGIVYILTSAAPIFFVMGWELAGLSSVLLIAYFNDRTSPVAHSRLALATHRIGDIGLLLGLGLLAHRLGAHVLPWGEGPLVLPSNTLEQAAILALVIAAASKAALLPFSAWLPRAMEGPTPSSAVYYGALYVHAGIYLLWRIAPLLAAIPGALTLLVLLGGLTAAFATVCGRVRSDVKTQLAFAALGQLGIIVVEIGLGWLDLALAHMIGHMVLRSFQLFTSPSALNTFRHLQVQRATASRSWHLEQVLPPRLRAVVYRLALVEFHLLDLVTLLAVRPLVRVANALQGTDQRLLARLRFHVGDPRIAPAESSQLTVLRPDWEEVSS